MLKISLLILYTFHAGGDFVNRLKEIRIARGWSQAQLAKQLNCTDVTVSRYETGQHGIDSETIVKICDIFGCTADYLLGRSSSPTPEISDADAALLAAFHAAPPSVVTAITALLQPYQKESEAEQAI